MRGKSIFGFICENLTEKGELNEEFRLPYDSDDSIGFMDGAKDGICIYHFGAENVTDEQISKMFQAVQLASENKTDEADEKFRDFANEYRMINVVNEFQTCIMEHKEELDPVNLYKYAIHLLLESDDRECVKAGMVILELLNIDDELKDVVRILGLSDEFTIFAIYVMKDWENSALEIFELAKKVHGWGRVHAVAYLEPVNDEIRHWLLTEGTDNDVLPAYSGLICFQKAEVEQELEKDVLSREIMHGILKIIDAMLDEGPVPGISQLEDPESVLNKILKHARQSMPLQVEDYEMIQNISMWAENQVVNPEIMRLAEAILCDERCLEAVKAEVKKGKHIRLAVKLGIDYKEDLLAAMEEDFNHLYFNCGYLINDPAYMDKIIELYRKNLPLEELKTGAADELGLGQDFEKNNMMIFILQELWNKVGIAEDIVETAIQMPVVRTRNAAVKVMQSWVENRKQPLCEISPFLYQVLAAIKDREVSDHLIKKINALVAGQTSFKGDKGAS